MNQNTSDTIFMTIQAPSAVVWQGEVRSVESANSEGQFTILPDHANFMTPLESTDIIVTFADSSERVYRYEHAVLFLENNRLTLYVHDETPQLPDEVVASMSKE